MTDQTWLWIGFNVFVLAMLALLQPETTADDPRRRLPAIFPQLLRVERRLQNESWPADLAAQGVPEAEAESRRLRENFRRMTEHSHQGVAVIRGEQMLYTNPALATDRPGINDGFGNTATCTATVTVRDTIPPTLTAGPVLVAGTVADGRVIHAGGKVTGKIRYGKLQIEEGGELSGDVGTLAAAEPRKDLRPLGAKPLAGLV